MKEIGNSIDFIDIGYKEFENLKMEHTLDVDTYLYDDSDINKDDKLTRYKVHVDNELRGILIYSEPNTKCNNKKKRIEYFEVLRLDRYKGMGKSIIARGLDKIEQDIYLTPIDKGAEIFWLKCGFEKFDRGTNELVYRSKSEHNRRSKN